MKIKRKGCEKVTTLNRDGCQKAKDKRRTRKNKGLVNKLMKKFETGRTWMKESNSMVPTSSNTGAAMDVEKGCSNQFVVENECLTTCATRKADAMEIDETNGTNEKEIVMNATFDDLEISNKQVSSTAVPKVVTVHKVEKRKRNRNPLTYVNKSYKGVNKMDLEQKSYDEALKLFDGSARKVTRSIVKVIGDQNEEWLNVKREQDQVKKKKKRQQIQPIVDKDVKTNKQIRLKFNEQKLHFHRGQMVWGYFRGWWPALIIEPQDVGMLPSKDEAHFVFWIGSKQISEIDMEKIELFSERLHMIVNVFNQPELLAKKYKPCKEAVELLNEKLRDPEMRLTGKWVEKSLYQSKDKVDGVRFYPYPNDIERTLGQLKQTHKIASKKKNQTIKKEQNLKKERKEKKYKPDVVVVSLGSDQLELKDQHIGTIAWYKETGQELWPVMIVDYRDGDMKEPKFKKQWVVRYGDYAVTQVDVESFIIFRNGFNATIERSKQLTVKEYLKKSKKKIAEMKKISKKEQIYEQAILQATKDYCEQRGLQTKDWEVDDVIVWLDDSNQHADRREVVPSYSNIIRQTLYLKKMKTFECLRKETIEGSDMLRNVIKKRIDINEICLICLKVSTKYKSHPFFKGKICEDCIVGYLPTLYKFGTDGKFVFCSLCGGVGTMVVCSTSNCPFVYCVGCLKCLIIPKDFDKVMMQDPWNCFFCNKTQTYKKLVTQPRDNWRAHRDKMLNNFPRDFNPVLNPDGSKKKARVLSLFDGISTGFLALKELKIEVEVYYASEIDPDAIKVSHMNFPTEITRIGDVREIDETMIREMAPIDLLIGGSPCNDLSMANPKRKGLNDPTGTGILFYDYVRIKELVEKVNQGHKLFWLYENVASMSTECKERISECLGRKPDVIDSAQYSAQHRPRLYWNNFPDGISSYDSPDLQDMLDPHCGRTALVKKMRTITANRNSLKKGRNFDLKPILMNGVPDVLRTSELERIFGFPPHYTDANINLCTRHKLIGKSWSVPTIRALMYPLCEYFKTTDN